MAIVKMRKLNLVGMSYEKDLILNALQRTNAAEVTLCGACENTEVGQTDCEELKGYLSVTESALSTLSSAVERYEKERDIKSDLLKDGFEVSYSEFMASASRKEEVDELVARIQQLIEEKNVLKAELASVARAKGTAKIYSGLEIPFSAFGDTAHTRGRLGTVSLSALDGLTLAVEEAELCACKTISTDSDTALVHIVYHRSVSSEAESLLSSFAFSHCPYTEGAGKKTYERLLQRENAFLELLNEKEEGIYALKSKIRLLKVYCDYLIFSLEKAQTSDKLRETQTTFLLQAYVPEPAEAQVREAIESAVETAYMEFSEPTNEDEPPTLLKNNSLVANFEGITNTYSAPHYREFDPNAVMAFFYSLFMGFIIGDAGYGILMLLGGGYLWWKNRVKPTGMSRLAGAFAIGGIFAILWGALFNSLFGFSVLPKTVMPNPQTDMWMLVGIAVPSVLIIAMLVGIVQLFAGYICKAVQEWRRGNVMDGICDGVLWAIFSVGVALAILGLTEEVGVPILGTVGGITAGVSLLLAMLTAGRKEKFFGKFTKGFGAAYGVINYASDILSYARLYGLMLSGAVIAQIIAQYSGSFIVSGNVLMILLGIVLLVVGNAFNLVMNLLGAYIHDARLQYVEFYGRFFEGDGALFTPLGSNHKYISLLPADGE